MIGPRHCPVGTVFDDIAARCDHAWKVPDCHKDSVAMTGTSSDCVSSCRGYRDGFYQSCSACDKFVQCNKGHMHTLPCPAATKWNDNKKLCDSESTTCVDHKALTTRRAPAVPMATTTQAPVASSPSKPLHSSTKCVESCTGLPIGDYQSCLTCSMYVSCVPGSLYPTLRPCPSGLVWDDELKVCNWSSTTCDPSSFTTKSPPVPSTQAPVISTTESEPNSSGDGDFDIPQEAW